MGFTGYGVLVRGFRFGGFGCRIWVERFLKGCLGFRGLGFRASRVVGIAVEDSGLMVEA